MNEYVNMYYVNECVNMYYVNEYVNMYYVNSDTTQVHLGSLGNWHIATSSFPVLEATVPAHVQ